jgi:sugar phosphate isomerase/epimerase
MLSIVVVPRHAIMVQKREHLFTALLKALLIFDGQFTMNELGKRISDQGLKFGVHANLWTQLQDREEIDQLMESTDPHHVYMVLDTGHIIMAGIDPVELTKT